MSVLNTWLHHNVAKWGTTVENCNKTVTPGLKSSDECCSHQFSLLTASFSTQLWFLALSADLKSSSRSTSIPLSALLASTITLHYNISVAARPPYIYFTCCVLSIPDPHWHSMTTHNLLYFFCVCFSSTEAFLTMKQVWLSTTWRHCLSLYNKGFWSNFPML